MSEGVVRHARRVPVLVGPEAGQASVQSLIRVRLGAACLWHRLSPGVADPSVAGLGPRPGTARQTRDACVTDARRQGCAGKIAT